MIIKLTTAPENSFGKSGMNVFVVVSQIRYFFGYNVDYTEIVFDEVDGLPTKRLYVRGPPEHVAALINATD